ncbi:hypothetical protein Y032_0047g1427 [Ancylostoma ceylanicum]|uniref:Thioesterase domain-containing protein n=1 Tax=Ancylostoma ceylanicum TaxID=53326 RepID=A0A016UBW8_9BILA|nr:hypothetical protein Y032_0047g1427 [Ancylostoma ceylanicum]
MAKGYGAKWRFLSLDCVSLYLSKNVISGGKPKMAGSPLMNVDVSYLRPASSTVLAIEARFYSIFSCRILYMHK